MSKKSFIHLSDIHFVKSSNKPYDIDSDLRKAIITDLKINAKTTLENVAGILVSGDVAYSGKEYEYNIAKEFLMKICDIFEITHSDVYCVPGNHDVDQDSITNCEFIPQVHNSIASATSIDEADENFSKYIHPKNQSMLLVPFENYNNFASRFKCTISADELFWEKLFQLEDDFNLRIIGINSAFISTKDDHKTSRLMHIGQSQVPDYKDNTATLLRCHHPPICWSFEKDIIDRVNKRADIQLYGHMHSQSVNVTDENVILYSGAVHPTRKVDWHPRYNWITIGSETVDDEKILDIEIFPRCLSKDRDSFEVDKECGVGKKSISHKINIDRKRKANLDDTHRFCCSEVVETTNNNPQDVIVDTHSSKFNERDLTYYFFDLHWVKQIDILMSLELIDESDKSKTTHELLATAIERAKLKDKYEDFYNKVVK